MIQARVVGCFLKVQNIHAVLKQILLCKSFYTSVLPLPAEEKRRMKKYCLATILPSKTPLNKKPSQDLLIATEFKISLGMKCNLTSSHHSRSTVGSL